MVEWHVTPDYIVNNWTDELFDLMVEKLVARKGKEHEAVSVDKTVPVEVLAARSRGGITVERKHSTN